MPESQLGTKIVVWLYWLAVAVISLAAWHYFRYVGLALKESLGAKPLPGITALAVGYREWFLGPPVVLAVVALWLSRSILHPSSALLFTAVSVLSIVVIVSVLFLATILPLTMGGPIPDGYNPSFWQWLLIGPW
jgi:hypothetical protein